MERLTQAECARLIGCTRQYVHKLIKSSRVSVDDRGRVDPVEVRQHLTENADPARTLAAADGEVLPLAPLAAKAPPAAAARRSLYQVARGERESYTARLAQLDYESRIGQVLDRDDVTDAFFNIGQQLQRKLEARAVTLANKIAGLTDPRDIVAAIQRADYDALKEIHDEFVRAFADAAATQSAA